jgi:outer membrane immunogenic protein
MKRNIIRALTVSALLIATPLSVAGAADMAVKAPPPPPAPIWSWTGLYIGANAGGGWSHTDWQDNHFVTCAGGLAFAVPGCDIPQKSSSFVGGGQIGARWQTSQWVFGIEGTLDYANLHAFGSDPAAAAAGGGAFLLDDTRLRNLYTVTGQVGLAWDRFLGYVKGGWAGSRLSLNTIVIATPSIVAPVSENANGWTVGTGLEYRLASLPNVSVGIEYDYIRLAAGNVATCTSGAPSIFSCSAPTQPLLYNNFHANMSEVLARLNYTFNWAGPVASKY